MRNTVTFSVPVHRYNAFMQAHRAVKKGCAICLIDGTLFHIVSVTVGLARSTYRYRYMVYMATTKAADQHPLIRPGCSDQTASDGGVGR